MSVLFKDRLFFDIMNDMKRKFAYEIENGAIMDFVDDRFMLVIKDDVWEPEEIKMLKAANKLTFCWTMDIAIFVFEGGDIDSSDFYFNIQECDQKDSLLQKELLDVEVVLVDGNNEICWSKQKTLNKEQSQAILQCLKKQAEISFAEDEFDINVQGLQSAYEPFELEKYALFTMSF